MRKELPVFTIMHFLVDFSCIFRMFVYTKPSSISNGYWLIFMVLYNFLAFALPGFLGLVADIIDKNHILAAIGCVLVGLSFVIPKPVVLPVILSGVGNGLFHIGCGRQILQDSKDRYAPSGIFICSGAFGVFLGTSLAGIIVHPLDYAMCISMIVSAVVLLVFGKNTSVNDGMSADLLNSKPSTRFLTMPAVLLILVVIFRSFYGTACSYSWKNTFTISLIFSLCIVAGKALGGIVCDRIGIRLTTIISLAGAAVTVLFSGNSIFLGCLSILLFNMTMPLTLTLLAKQWKGYPGFAFGFLMFGLFVGLIPSYMFDSVVLPYYLLGVVCVVSMIMLVIACRRDT